MMRERVPQRPSATTPEPELRRMPLVALLALLWIMLVDLATKIPLGPASLSAMLTLATAASLLAVAPSVVGSMVTRGFGRWNQLRLPVATPLGLLLFMVLTLVRLAAGPSMEGLQNVSVYVGFVLGIVVTADAARHQDRALWTRLMPAVTGVVSIIFFVAFVLLHADVYGDRSYALSALVFLAIVVPLRGGGWRLLLPFFIVLCTVLSLSRTASLIAVLCLLFLVVRGPRRGRVLKVVAMTLAAALFVVALWFLYAPFRDRFTSGDAAVSVGGTALNTSGRSELWAAAWRNAMSSPVFGHGAGNATELITRLFVTISQPHNEYLRIFNDFGVLGVGLWIWGMVSLTVVLARRAHAFDRPVDWSALIAVMGICLASVTDNMIIYPFVMVPAGVVIGLSLAATEPPPELVAQTPDNHPAPVGDASHRMSN